MGSASAPASDLAVQPTAPASSVAVPPPAASTTEAVGLSLPERVACFFGEMDGRVREHNNLLRLRPTWDPRMIILLVHTMICSWGWEYRHERENRGGNGEYFLLYNFGPAGHKGGLPAGSRTFARRRIRGPDPRVRPAG